MGIRDFSKSSGRTAGNQGDGKPDSGASGKHRLYRKANQSRFGSGTRNIHARRRRNRRRRVCGLA